MSKMISIYRRRRSLLHSRRTVALNQDQRGLLNSGISDSEPSSRIGVDGEPRRSAPERCGYR